MKLFLLNAPRYLSYYIAMLEKKNEQGVLIIACDFHFLDIHYTALVNLQSNPFVEIIILSEKYFRIKHNFYKKFKYRNLALKTIEGVFKKHPISEVIASNDGPLFNQYAFYLNKSRKNIYLEDGMFNYLLSHKKHSWYSDHVRIPLHNWFYKKVYFKEWLPNLGVGNNPYTDELYFTYPDCIAYDLGKPLYQLSANQFLYQSQFIISLLNTFNLSQMSLESINYIILLDYHGRKQQQERKKYQKKLLKICQQFNKKGLKIALKTHPRDFSCYDEIEQLDNVVFLPAIAFEFFLPFISDKTTILGGFSTSIMLANALSTFKVKTITSTNFSKSDDAKMLFARLGIDNIGDISKICS